MKKKQIKKRYITIKEHTFKLYLNLFVNYSFKELNQFLKKRNCEAVNDQYQYYVGVAFVSWGDDRIPIFTIWLPSFGWDIKSQAVLVHELSHIVSMMLCHCGIDIVTPKKSANEPYAYLLEYFFLAANRKLDKMFNN